MNKTVCLVKMTRKSRINVFIYFPMKADKINARQSNNIDMYLWEIHIESGVADGETEPGP